jgi:L-malate glycosyltransferase
MNSVKHRVLIIENSIDITGALKSVTRTAYDLSSFYDFVFVIPKKSKGRSWIEGKKFNTVIELPMREINRSIKNITLYLPYLVVNAFRLSRLVKQENISLIHVNDVYNLLPVALRLFGSKKPYVCHIRFLPDRFPPWLFNFWLKLHCRYAEKIIAVSESVRVQLPFHEKIVVIHNELPVEERYPQTLSKTDHSNRFLYLSNFMDGKGQNFAIEAFAKIHFDLPNWKMRFVGGDMGLVKNKEYLREMKQKSHDLNINEKIEWSTFTEDVEREYKLADIVLNFSESESFSITCLEALYFGRPLIATNCGGPAEIVDDNVTGLLIPNRDVRAMAVSMLALAQDPNLREKFATNARLTVRKKFSLENTSLRLKTIYDYSLVP